MDGGVSPTSIAAAMATDNPMDLDLIEEYLLGGACWSETPADFSQITSPFTSSSASSSSSAAAAAAAAAMFDMQSPWPPMFDDITKSIPSENTTAAATTTTTTTQEDEETASTSYLLPLPEKNNHLDSQTQTQTGALVVDNLTTTTCSSSVTAATTTAAQAQQPSSSQYQYQVRNHHLLDGTDLSKFFWIGPQTFPTSSSVTRRLLTAMNYIKDSATNKDILIQIWVPVDKGGSRVLTTINQPFTLDSGSARLISYRNISEGYHFAAEEQSDTCCLGLPGRVYVGKVPEWTPDVRFFRADEYPRVIHAQEHDVRGTLALPVFEQRGQVCLGVIEVVMTTQKVNYRHELEFVCKALEAVDLRSSEIPIAPITKEESYKTVVPEIQEVLRSACSSHGLPLAQAWVPCVQQGKQGCRHNDRNLAHCVSTIDDACFVSDPTFRGFQDACSEHHLLKGQGVVGGAFLRNKPCFCPDITNYGQTEYPLSHHARVFGLCAAVAIRFRSIYTANADFVLEFFLPSDCRDPEEQRRMLSSLSVVIQQSSSSLRVVTDEELLLDPDYSSSTLTNNNSGTMAMNSDKIKSEYSSSSPPPEMIPSPELLLEGLVAQVKQEQNEESGGSAGFRVNGYGDCESDSGGVPAEKESTAAAAAAALQTSSPKTSADRRRTKSDRVITAEVLRQHFAGSLKDAAKSLGVCPTTLKRICRQHGIKRWPSRKIKKVGHSLQKLQVVMDSVHGASGSFQIGSFYSTFPDLASPNASESFPFSPSKEARAVVPSEPQATAGKQQQQQHFSPCSAAPKSPSSSHSQTSSSSQCCSSGGQNQQPPATWNNNNNNYSAMSGELAYANNNLDDCSLKRARSIAEITPHEQEGIKPIPRCQSQMTLGRPAHHTADVQQQPYGSQQQGSPAAVAHGDDAWRVKVTHEEEKIRFRMGKGWGFKELEQEVVRRFSLGDLGGFHIKYLDDDSEWVLLTCDADLEECIEICTSLEQQTIRLALHMSRNQSKSSFGSNKHPGQ